MSSSIPESTISFYEPEATVRKKVMSAITGGRMTLAEQKQKGGEPEKCSLFLLNLFHMVMDDAELEEIRRKCMAGEMTCGQCKKETAERVLAFLKIPGEDGRMCTQDRGVMHGEMTQNEKRLLATLEHEQRRMPLVLRPC